MSKITILIAPRTRPLLPVPARDRLALAVVEAAPGLVLSFLRVLVVLRVHVVVEERAGGCFAVAVAVHDAVAEGRGADIGVGGLAAVGGCGAVEAGVGVGVGGGAEGRRVGGVGAPVGAGSLLVGGLALPLGGFVGDEG
jgi:hypothetical protein